MNICKRWIPILCVVILCTACHKKNAQKEIGPSQPKAPEIIHKAHLDNGWYIQSKEALEQEIKNNLNIAQQYLSCSCDPDSVRALIVPHAGHTYSGLCAASAYQTLLNPEAHLPLSERKNTTIKRVIILSPSHTHFFTGIALPEYTSYQTVLGAIPVDSKALAILHKESLCKAFADAHNKEHALEIQLPFLQTTVADFSIVPLIVGHIKDEADIDAICNRLEKIIDETTLVVISSDFIHYGTFYEYSPFSLHIIPSIRMFDAMAISAITQQSYYLFMQFLNQTNASICGQDVLKLFLALLGKKAFKQELTSYVSCYYTSPQIMAAKKQGPLNPRLLFVDPDDKDASSSVSYTGMVFTSDPISSFSPKSLFTGYEQQALLALARSTIGNDLRPAPEQLPRHLLFPITTPALQEPGGAFVTLMTHSGELRGCIGHVTTSQPLYKTIQTIAHAAAFEDSRFKPLTKEELETIKIEITILTKPHPVASYKDIIIGQHGIILHKHDAFGREIASALFLPQVATQQGWDLETTLDALSHKAGLDYDDWQTNCRFEVFEGFMIEESISKS